MAKAATRAWQRMLSGRRLDLLDPSPIDIEIEDIAHGLARVARWNGQTHGEHSFSVAEHSVLVTHLVRKLDPRLDNQALLIALLHDAPEYVVGDLISPFKAAVGIGYSNLEERLMAAILLRFGLPADPPRRLWQTIKKADTISAYLEATQLAGFDESEAEALFTKPPADWADDPLLQLKPNPISQAKAEFLKTFESLA